MILPITSGEQCARIAYVAMLLGHDMDEIMAVLAYLIGEADTPFVSTPLVDQ